MTAYAVAHLRDVRVGAWIVDYLGRIDATLAPFGGRFLVHGGDKTVLEGSWPGDLVVIGFPDLERAQAWYASADYRAIVKLRTDHAGGDVVLVEGVSEDHRATDILDGRLDASVCPDEDARSPGA